MDRPAKLIVAVTAIIAIAVIGAVAYSTLSAPTVVLTGLQALSTNPGLTANASSSERQVNPGQNFSAVLSLSPHWPISVEYISIATPGFSIISLNASLPLRVDQNTTLSVVLRSDQSYSGAVLFIVNCLNSSDLAEKILIPDVTADTSSKTVVLVSVSNVGDVALSNSTAYLIRSDGLAVNSTPLHTEGLLPGKISYFNINMSYAAATIIELYRVQVVTALGANATSRVFALTCNC